MTVKLVTFKTTQTLIANVEQDGDKVILKEPVQVIVQPSKTNEAVMGFAPFLEYCEEFKEGITVPFDAVLTITTPVRELENQYSKVFGSGIQIASVIPNA
jgi:diaminopimelate epimerase